MPTEILNLLLLVVGFSRGQDIPSVPDSNAYATPKPHRWAHVDWLTRQPMVTEADENISKPRLYELTNDMNLVCFRAVLDAQVFFSYKAKNADNTLTIKRVLLRLPEKPLVSGKCNPLATEFTLTWDAGYELFFRFEIQGTNWMATEVQFLVDTAYLNDAIQSVVVLATNPNGTAFFTTPLASSFRCDYSIDVPMELTSDQVVNGVGVNILNIQVQAFGVPQKQFSEPSYCTPTFAQEVQINSAPIIVASVLAAVIVLIVIVYFIYKNRSSKYEEISGRRIYEHVKDASSSAFGHVKNASNQAVGHMKNASNQAAERVRSAYSSYGKKTEETDIAKSEQPTYSSLENNIAIDDDEMPIIDQVDDSNEQLVDEPNDEPNDEPKPDDYTSVHVDKEEPNNPFSMLDQ